MNNDTRIKLLREAISRMDKLLSQPETGLISWWMLLGEAYHQIVMLYEGTEGKYNVPTNPSLR